MDFREVVFGFLVVLAASLDLVFFVGDMSDPPLHDIHVLFAALGVNLTATMRRLGDRTTSASCTSRLASLLICRSWPRP